MSSNEPATVLLESSDGFQFIVRRSAAIKSPAIKGMLSKRSKYFLHTAHEHVHIRRNLSDADTMMGNKQAISPKRSRIVSSSRT